MKKFLFAAIIVFINTFAMSQDITGKWNGILKVPGMELRVSFNISTDSNKYIATMDSPDQNAFGIPMSTASFTNNELKITHIGAAIDYTGTYDNVSKITGTFIQGGQSFPLDLTRGMPEKAVLARPQDPVQPYPYYSEEVTFENKADSLILAGTLTMPKKGGKYPVAILITGSGPQNRDEELMGHKPFLVLSDYLTKNGIAVLRYDDRGTGKSTGVFRTSNTADFARDVESAIAYLRSRSDIDQSHIGLIGHSEGGIIAPMVAAHSKDVNFIVLMAGTGVRGDELLLMQQELIGRATGTKEEELTKIKAINRKAFDIVIQNNDQDSLKVKLTRYMKQIINEVPESEIPKSVSQDDFINMTVSQTLSPWMQYFIRLDPTINLKLVKCQVLAINGSKDLQVPPQVNLNAIHDALISSDNKNITIKELPGLNHLFQECTTGDPSEYSKIEQTISPIALTEICDWVKKVVTGL